MAPFITRLSSFGSNFGVRKKSFYFVTPSTTSVNEGSTVSFTINTINVPDGTVLYWTDTGTVNSSDFVGGVTSGSFTINNNSGSFSRTLSNDATTEGPESFQIQIRTGSVSGTVVTISSVVNVGDTSLTPTYSITPSTTSVNEGSFVNFTVNTTNVSNGTTLYWRVSGTTNSSDFSSSSGSFSISSNTGSFSAITVNDATTEGSETFAAIISTSPGGSSVVTSQTITINDTSPDPTYWFSRVLSGARSFRVVVDSTQSSYTTGWSSSGSTYIPMVYKLSPSGKILWQKTFNTNTPNILGLALGSSNNVHISVHVSGSVASEIVKMNSSGSILWRRRLTGYNQCSINGITVDSSDNVYSTGLGGRSPNSNNILFLTKHNSSGTLQWQRELYDSSASPSQSCYGNSVAVDSSGNVFVCGSFYNGSSWSMFLVKYNSSGTIQWQKGLFGTVFSTARDLSIDSSGNVYMVSQGYTSSMADFNIYVSKFSSNGTLQWQKYFDSGLPSDDDRGEGIYVDSSDNVYVTGWASSSGFFVKYNSSGVLQYQRTISGSESQIFDCFQLSNFLYLCGNSTIRLPLDGSLTGNYTSVDGNYSYNYQVSSIFESASSFSPSTVVLTDSAGTMTESSGSLSISDTSYPLSIAAVG